MATLAPERPIQPARHETRPPASLAKAIQEHVARTGRPETFLGLHPGPIAKSEAFLILGPLSVPRDKREDGTKAPCPMCQPNKFYEGKIVYFTGLRVVAAIGHCCADSDLLRAAERQYAREQAVERAHEILLAEIPKAAEKIAAIEQLLPVAVEADRVFACFRKEGRWYQTALRKAVKETGRLIVNEIIGPAGGDGPRGMRTSGSTVETRAIEFGGLDGHPAFGTGLAVADSLRSARAMIRPHLFPDDDAVLEFLTGLTEDEQIALAASLDAVATNVSDARNTLIEFQRFFTDPNLERITQWGSHPDAINRMQASIRRPTQLGGRVLFGMKGGTKEVAIIIEDVLWTPLALA